jgi:hypothetical protein
MNVRLTTIILGLAMLESSALFGGIVFLVERSTYGLQVAAASMLLQLTLFPTERRVRAWLDEQLARLEGYRRGQDDLGDVSTL